MKFILPISAILMILSKANADKVSCSPYIEKKYGCCDAPCAIVRTDIHGYWGKQNGKECGCGVNVFDKFKVDSCSSFFTDQGYDCCSHCEAILKDENGYYWGGKVHNITYTGTPYRYDEWCGISDFCLNIIGIVDKT